MTIASKLETINEALGDIKSSIVAKGVTPTGDITTYSTAIKSISTGDEITATNTTGSAISADDKVWVNGVNVYTPDFSRIQYSYGTISDGIYTLTPSAINTNEGGVSKTLSNAFNYSSDFEIVIKAKISNLIQNNQVRNIFYLGADGNSFYNPLSTTLRFCTRGNAVNSFWWFLGTTQIIQGSDYFSNMTNNQWYWFKLTYNTASNVLTTYQSMDGITYTQIATTTYALPSSSGGTYILLGLSEFNSTTAYTGYVDLRASYVKSGDDIIWTPYTTSTTYSIINDTDITSTSFTGIAQEAIVNNATGSVKTLLDGNGTYAPTTATKSITTNGTYTASAENAYGFSSVTVDVPSAPTKKYNLLDRVTDDSNNEIGTVSGFFTDANNVEYAVVCLDAQYRLASGQVMSEASQYGVPLYKDIGLLEAKETATQNTDAIITKITQQGFTSTACSHCRNKSFTIDGTTYYGQLSNILELIDIFRNRVLINSVDTSASSYSNLILQTNKYVWSSTQYSSTGSWCFHSDGVMYYDAKNQNYFVIPVLEIPNT